MDDARPTKPPSPLALPVIAPGQWRAVGRLQCLRLDSAVGLLLWQEGDGSWHYRSSGMGVFDEELRVSSEPGLLDARRQALRWLAGRAALVADQASAVLVDGSRAR